jgi:acyl dehydratase
MPLDYDKLMGCRRETSQRYTARDTMLYALGVGAGIDADTPDKLRFVYEEKLDALPTMSVVLATPGFWLREPQFGIVWQKVLHAEQSVVMHAPLAVCGEVVSVLTVDAIYDKGSQVGALLYTCRRLWEKTSGNLLATLRQAAFLRGDGGAGGLTTRSPKPHPIPQGRPADLSIKLGTRCEQALLYRLSGDYNPLHADPDVARLGGFSRPILHGLATYGVVGRALLSAVCANRAARLRRLDARFSSAVYPGEDITTEIWREGNGRVSFRALVSARDTVVINHGYAEYE